MHTKIVILIYFFLFIELTLHPLEQTQTLFIWQYYHDLQLHIILKCSWQNSADLHADLY